MRNPVSIAGAWLTTLSVFAFVAFVALEQFGLLASPYAGLFGFMVVPAFFVLGLLLIPIGIWIEARRRRARAGRLALAGDRSRPEPDARDRRRRRRA